MHAMKSNFFFRFALLFLAVCCIGMLVALQVKNNTLSRERDALLAQIDEGEARVQSVQAVLDTPFDEEYVIKIAREKLNLRLPEEIVFYNDLND